MLCDNVLLKAVVLPRLKHSLKVISCDNNIHSVSCQISFNMPSVLSHVYYSLSRAELSWHACKRAETSPESLQVQVVPHKPES